MAGKTFKTIDELSVLLVKERGLECEDVGELERFLRLTNYYRFSLPLFYINGSETHITSVNVTT